MDQLIWDKLRQDYENQALYWRYEERRLQVCTDYAAKKARFWRRIMYGVLFLNALLGLAGLFGRHG